MTLWANPWAMQANAHSADRVRVMTQALLDSPAGSFAGGVSPTTGGGGHGVVGADDLKVTATGTPDMNVHVDVGMAFVRGTESNHQGVYPGYNPISVTLAIATSDPNPRKDLICLQVRDSQYSGASDDARLVVVTGTPLASPVDPSVPDNCLVLARVLVDGSVGTIVAGKITDLRPRACSLGGIHVCTSTTRPTGAALFEGLYIDETDTNKIWRYDGTNFTLPKNVAGGVIAYASTASSVADPTAGSGTHDVLTATATVAAGRKVRISVNFDRCNGSGAVGDIWSLQLVESSTVLRECRQYVIDDASTGNTAGQLPVVTLTPSAGSHTYKFRFKNIFASGTFTVYGSATGLIELVVEDIGGA